MIRQLNLTPEQVVSVVSELMENHHKIRSIEQIVMGLEKQIKALNKKSFSENLKEWYRVKEVALMFNRSPDAFRKSYIDTGRVRSEKRGKYRMIPGSEVKRLKTIGQLSEV